MNFWERIATKVRDKTNLSEVEYSAALEEQEDVIIDFLSFNCHSEADILPEVWEIKKEILELYTSEIASLISRIEVYSHTLHASAVEAIYNLLQYITAAELASNDSEMVSFYGSTLSYAYFIKFTFQKSLSELYFDRIEAYKRMIKNFNHQGVLIEQTPFVSVVNKKIKKARKQYHTIRRKLRTRVRENEQRVAELDLVTFERNIGFDDLIAELEGILLLYEWKMPSIIGNGYNMSAGYRIVSRCIAFISGGFLLYGFLSFGNLWDPLVTFCLNLF